MIAPTLIAVTGDPAWWQQVGAQSTKWALAFIFGMPALFLLAVALWIVVASAKGDTQLDDI